MRAAAGAISRALARPRAHLEIAFDGLEIDELQFGQLCVIIHLTHAWPRASFEAGEARRDVRGCGREQPSKGDGARALGEGRRRL